MNMKKILAIVCAAVLITACAAIPIAFAGENGKSDNKAAAATGKISDDSSKVDTSDATSFKFTDSEIAVTEGAYSGYKVKGTSLTLNESGTYVLSGSCKDGSVKVKKGTSGVNIVLDGIDLTSSDTAPLALNKSSEVTVTVADNTENTLTDSKLNNSDDNAENENAENAVIKCKDGSKVTITGGGTLNINANAKNGIKSGSTTDEEGEAYLTIKQATININASVNDGINAGQLLNIESGNITVKAADDGIHCDYVMNIGAKDTDGPTVNITDCYEGLEASELNVYSGNIKIHSEDDCMNAANSDLKDYSFKLNIAGGTLYMDSESGDGIDSNGTLTISGGSTEVWTANNADNQPLDADGEISITGGTVFAAGGSAGMGMNLTSTQPCLIFGSTGSADGNPGGGQQDGQQDGQQGGKPNGTPPQMNGSQDGNMTPPDMNNSQNGDSNMTPPDKKNSQDGDSNMTPPDKKDSQDDGGNMTPPDGNAGMPQGGGNAIISSDSTVTIKDSDGNTLYTAKAVCNVNQVVYSSDKLTADSSYTLYSGDTSVGTATAATGNISRENGRGGPSGDDSFDPDNKPQKPDGNSGTTKSDDTESTTANSSKSDQTTTSAESGKDTTKSSDNTKSTESTKSTDSTTAAGATVSGNSSAKSVGITSANSGDSDSDSPLTGVMEILPWIALAVLSAAGVTSIILLFRRKSK